MKKFSIIAIIFTLFSFMSITYANTINEITDADYTDIVYPIRSNAVLVLLQPVPDNSGDYTMTICNKESHCRQTSMLYRELRYIGLFLEDTLPSIQKDLNKKLTKEQWLERQGAFRSIYAEYMNMYDKNISELKSLRSK